MRPLRESQRAALNVLCDPERTFAALWAEPRSGKTATCLRWVVYHKPKVVLVVGPKIAENVWRIESAEWLEDVSHRFYPLTVGNMRPDPSLLTSYNGVNILFINYEQFTKAAGIKTLPYIRSVARAIDHQGMMILDESHYIKTPNSVIGKAIRPTASDWKLRLIVTGTPVTNPNQVDAIYGQWTWLDPAIRDRWPTAKDFREYFGEWQHYKGFPELVRLKNQAELMRYLQPNVVTLTGQAEPVPHSRVMYRLDPTVEEWSTTLFREGVVKTSVGTVAALNPLTRLLRLRQMIAGHCMVDTGNDEEIRYLKPAMAARLRALAGVLNQVQGKVIISCSHIAEVNIVSAYLSKKGTGYSVVTGATSNKDMALDKFRASPTCRVLIVQPQTVSMAVDISVANSLIWYTSDFNYVTFKQTSDRIKLSPAKPRVYFLCARGSVDEDVWDTLMVDHDHLRKVLDKIRRR